MKRILVKLASCTILFAGLNVNSGMANTIDPLGGLTSNGALGDISSYLNGNASPNWILDTDNSVLYYLGNTGGGPILLPTVTLASSLVSQNGGPDVRVFDFSSFTVNNGFTLNLIGALPAALIATGDFTINGTLSASAYYPNGQGAQTPGAGGGAHGISEYYGTDNIPTSGGSAGGGGGTVGGYGTNISGGGGGGGGNVIAGQGGNDGEISGSCTGSCTASGGFGSPGGAANPKVSSILNGGGGGGAGGNWIGPFFGQGGGGLAGGDGGGAIFLSTPGNFFVGATGVVSADGGSTPGCCRNLGGGGGGGGAGGALWFDVANTFTNEGVISAVGGGGSNGPDGLRPWFSPGGAGSGGVVYIDPLQIVNDGTIDVAAGDGSAGGLVQLVSPSISGSGQIEGNIAPEPSTMALALTAIAGMCLFGRKRPAFGKALR